jgi:hypothetical protein
MKIIKKDITKKQVGKQKSFQDEGHMQGGKKDPLTPKQDYGTGLSYKKPAAPLVKKKSVSRGK